MTRKHADKYRIIGLNIHYYRKLKGMNQFQLAEAVDVSRTHISNIEAPNVDGSISLDLLFDIANALDVDVTELLTLK